MKSLIILVVLLSFIALSSDQLCWPQYGADSRHTSNIDVNGLLKKPTLGWEFRRDTTGNYPWRIKELSQIVMGISILQL
ncbi:MAG: hypothetical protein JXA60_10590 [Candidatus Coatesbacteria bacterium]|nr:hypothetical protein [Candidatus Coatesbacteria bacterium]